MGVNLDLIKFSIGPIISPSHAIFSCIFFTLCFVGGLYFSKKTRIGGNNPRLTKDHPHVIMNRVISVVTTCIISFIGVWLLIHFSGGFKESMTILSEIYTTLVLLGFSLPTHPYHILNTFFIPLGLTMSLFIGPLFVKFLDKELPFQAKFNWRYDILNYITSLIGFRNLIFAPMTEEFVFRCCMVPLLALADFSRIQIIFLSPLVFGIAHIHHAWEVYVTNGRTMATAKFAIFASIFQFFYTTLFGWYATFLFMRTGHFIPPFFAHIFGNVMGFPVFNMAAYPKKVKKGPATNPSLYEDVGNSIYWYNANNGSKPQVK
ncbi:15396_t:CDS:2 [Funneliformis mosseae]|uniref:intramembrane prenyl-peptidase Rce1 n=1 Tax=Funneliformis mosseae TaxID=27381 RepID=A0A9N8YN41_FUNMO|nr:15396_t:CDS:2 [Funneliformis mosseae]